MSASFCYVNGRRYELPPGRGEATLLQWLREVGLTGTKLGCGEGGCGACTVMVSRKKDPDGKVEHLAINACLCPLYSVAECHVVTVEGIGNVRDGLHPVQARLANAHGSQCGFCTPGFVMSMYALLRSKPEAPSKADIETALAGNLCRCTGYRPILDAFACFTAPGADASVYTKDTIAASANGHANGNEALANGEGHADAENGSKLVEGDGTIPMTMHTHGANADKSGPNGANGSSTICPSTGMPCDCSAAKGAGKENGHATNGVNGTNGKNGNVANVKSTIEPIFPPELSAGTHKELCIPGDLATWHRCVSLDHLLALKQEHPTAKLVGGNTEIAIEMRVKGFVYPILIDASYVPELNVLESKDGGLMVGGAVTLSDVIQKCTEEVEARPSGETWTMKAVLRQLHWFAGTQIRNAATLAGNIVTGSPISDLNPVWVACGATFYLHSSAGGERKVPAKDFFKGYRKVDMKEGEVLTGVHIPYNKPYEYVIAFKQAHRRDDDIALVNAGMLLRFELKDDAWRVAEVCLAYGGVAPSVLTCPKTAELLCEGSLTEDTVKAALTKLREDVTVGETAPGGMGSYRTALTSSFLYKFLMQSTMNLQKDAAEASLPSPTEWIAEEAASAVMEFERPPAHGVQFHAKATSLVGKPERHRAADLQVCGDAKYSDDVQMPVGTLHAALLVSSQAHAKIVSIDSEAALAMPGVHGFFTAKDVPGGNDIGPNYRDEVCFAEEEVTSVGHVIGILAAESRDLAKRAVGTIKVTYEALSSIVSIEEAIEAGSFHPQFDRTIERGDVDAAFASDEVGTVAEGVARMAGQEHFYLEPQCNFVVPIENDEYLLWASTQDVNKHHKLVSHVLGIPQHKLVCKTKRLGGGFGGKETRGVFLHCASAVASFRTGRPVSLVLDRQEDMQLTGHRHAFLGKYKIAAAADGRILAMDLKLFCNAGNSVDLSHAIMDRALLHCDAAFNIPNVRAHGLLCRTNQSSNTAFRGFGGPQGMIVTNMWTDHIARNLSMSAKQLVEVNFYKEGDLTHYGQKLDAFRLPGCWDEALAMSKFDERSQAVKDFNAKHRYRKRGIYILPTKFGISFTFKPMNQAGALINIYIDGSVAVTHGGVEMGQGLHTKMCQVAAQALKVPLDSVHIAETATDKLPNSSPTAASASSDLYGAAILDACAQLNERLAFIRERLGPEATMKEIASMAWMERVDLCAHGFYRTPDITGAQGSMPFNYYVYGAAVAEVEIDTLTGDWHNLRTDIVMDVGNPINPAIDIGQIEGGFVQGMGWTCLEELKWGDSEHTWIKPGVLLTNGPGNYKIPTANDIPIDFRVKLMQDVPNVRAVHSSKAVGEPPFHLGASVFFALKEAIYAAREAAGVSGFFVLDSPATPERIRMACTDEIGTQGKEHYVPFLSC